MTIRNEFYEMSKPDMQNLLALHQMEEWEGLMAQQEQARLDLENQLTQKYGWLSLKNMTEKNEMRSLLASWHDSDRVGINFKHLYQTRSLRLSDQPQQTLTELLTQDEIEADDL
ncbi:MAG: hypothetical protein ACRBDL_08885 [Alphaproteobacteria bacterium]